MPDDCVARGENKLAERAHVIATIGCGPALTTGRGRVVEAIGEELGARSPNRRARPRLFTRKWRPCPCLGGPSGRGALTLRLLTRFREVFAPLPGAGQGV